MLKVLQSYCWWFVRNPVNSPVEVGSLSHYLQGFIHPNGGWEWDFWTINSTEIHHQDFVVTSWDDWLPGWSLDLVNDLLKWISNGSFAKWKQTKKQTNKQTKQNKTRQDKTKQSKQNNQNKTIKQNKINKTIKTKQSKQTIKQNKINKTHPKNCTLDVFVEKSSLLRSTGGSNVPISIKTEKRWCWSSCHRMMMMMMWFRLHVWNLCINIPKKQPQLETLRFTSWMRMEKSSAKISSQMVAFNPSLSDRNIDSIGEIPKS